MSVIHFFLQPCSFITDWKHSNKTSQIRRTLLLLHVVTKSAHVHLKMI